MASSTYVNRVNDITLNTSAADRGKAVALAAQADEQRTANMLTALTLQSDFTEEERSTIRRVILERLGLQN